MSAAVELCLLGPFQASRGGQRLTTFKSNKVRALLAYLAVEREAPQHRDVLAGMLWPESTNRRALALLRDVLSDLRRILGDREAATPIIRVEGETLQLNPEALWLDLVVFTELAKDTKEASLARAVALYRGDFLEGFTLRNAPAFETWTLLRRETYQGLMLDALYRLTTAALQKGDYLAAQAHAWRQLTIDGYREDAHRQLLRALALDGQRNQALAHYANYRSLIAEELDVAPDIRTTALYQRIRDHQLKPASKIGMRPSPTGGDSLIPEAPERAPFVAREAELSRLKANLYRAQQGTGQILLVAGEAGSGKTLLVETFIRRNIFGAIETLAAWGTCNAQVSDGDPYLPFREILRLLTGDFDVSTLSNSLTPALAQRLETQAPDVAAVLQDLAPDLVSMLLPTHTQGTGSDLSKPGRPPLAAALCDQVTQALRAVARQHTLILVLDDPQWADNSTLNLLTHLSRQLHDSRILLIGTYRPSEASPGLSRALREVQRRWGDITLDLEQAAGRAFVAALLDSMPNALGPSFRERLYRQTKGHALFTVALVHQLQADGELKRNTAGEWVAREDLDWHKVPPRVEAVIAARIARLPDDLRKLLTVASVEGPIFTAEVVARTLELPNDMVQHALSGPLGRTHQLVAAQGMKRATSRRVAQYHFRHILFQEYLYAQLDPVQRAQFHERVGTILETLHADQAEAARRLAYHFEAAGLFKRAVTYLIQAGAHAYQLSAPAEAIKLYRRGLRLLEQLPASTARDRQELALQMGLNTPLFAIQGWGAPKRAAALQRAQILARRLNAVPEQLAILRSLADVHTAQAKHQMSLTYAEQLAQLSRETNNDVQEMVSYRLKGIAHFFLGHYQEAHSVLKTGIDFYKTLEATTSDPAALPDSEETVFMWAWLPMIRLALGYPEQAVSHSREALARIRNGGHVHAQAKMLTVAGAAFYAAMRQPDATLRYADDLLRLAKRYHLPAFQGWAVFYQGWANTARGNKDAGLARMTAGWEQLRATGTEASLVHLSLLWAEACADAGQHKRSAKILTRARRLADETNAHAYLAEIYRLHGKSVLEHPDKAETWFRKAIAVAQAQATKLWELRATVSLTRLWQAQGQEQEAYARLATIYAWFTEGFNMPDLIEAQALLTDLNNQNGA